MNKKFLEKKWIKLMIQDRILRLCIILILSFGILIIILLSTGSSYKKKVDLNLQQIADAELQLTKLEAALQLQEKSRDNRVIGRNFAPYEEIIPFINLLENIFGLIDRETKVTIKDNEKNIYINRYADYEVTLSHEANLPLLYKALDELQKSQFLTKTTSFNMKYKEDEKEKTNEIDEITLTIRLYFK